MRQPIEPGAVTTMVEFSPLEQPVGRRHYDTLLAARAIAPISAERAEMLPGAVCLGRCGNEDFLSVMIRLNTQSEFQRPLLACGCALRYKALWVLNRRFQ